MPVLVPDEGNPTEPIRRPPVAPRLSWMSPAGRVTPLDDYGNGANSTGAVFVAPGSANLGMPEYEYFEVQPPIFDGAVVRGHRALAREIDLPITLIGDDRSQLLDRWHRLVADMKPRAGRPGTLTVTDANGGNARSIQAYYAGGLQGQDDDRAWGMTFIQSQVTLKCPSPYWLGEGTSRRFQIGSASAFYPRGFPMEVSDSQVIGDPEVENTGGADTYPVFTITGPVSSVYLQNVTTGKVIQLTGGVAEGEVMTIDTRETARSVTVVEADGDVVNRYGDLTNASVLWPLVEGVNTLHLELPGATEVTTLTVAYQLRYLTAY